MMFLACQEILVLLCEAMVGRLQPVVLESLRTTLSGCCLSWLGLCVVPATYTVANVNIAFSA